MRKPFLKTCGILLRYKRPLFIALIGAVISAACFGVGLSLMHPVLEMFTGQEPRVVQEMILGKLDQPNMPQQVRDLGRWLAETIPADPFWGFIAIAIAVMALTIIGSIARYMHELLTITVSLRAAMVWRDRLFRRLMFLPLLTTQTGTGDNTSRIVVDTRILSHGYQALLGKAVAEIFKGAAALCVALWFNYALTGVALLAAPPIVILLRKFGKIVKRASQRTLQQQGRVVAALGEALAGSRVTKVHNAEGYERRRFGRMNRRLFNEEMAMRQARAMASPIVETFSIAAVLIVAATASWFIFERDISPSDFTMVMVALVAAAASLKPLTGLHIQLREADAAAVRVLDIMDRPIEPLGSASQTTPILPRHHRSIRFDEVTFSFPGQHEPAVKQVSLHVSFGQTVAVVGTNGSGKTTLLSMLPRLYPPAAGRVLIDDVDIATVNLRALRKQFGVVTQDSMLFEGSIADNIAYGRRHTARARIIEAAKAAHAHEFITVLPNGYDTLLGEGGSGLSGGQRQRLCIARAILRDPAILILDEATSQIDADSEAKINLALHELRRGRTTFVIAHRLSTVVDADLIIVMHDGEILDQGAHRELLARCETYRTLNRTQLQTV